MNMLWMKPGSGLGRMGTVSLQSIFGSIDCVDLHVDNESASQQLYNKPFPFNLARLITLKIWNSRITSYRLVPILSPEQETEHVPRH